MARILLVEDDENLRILLTRTLRRVGHEVVQVIPADEDFVLAAIEAITFDTNPFDLLLTDMDLGKRCGPEIIDRIIHSPQAKPRKIMIMSSNPNYLQFQGRFARFAHLEPFISTTYTKGDPAQNLAEIVAQVLAQND